MRLDYEDLKNPNNPLVWLPQEASDRLLTLTQRVTEHNATINALNSDVNDTVEKLRDEKARLQRLITPPSNGGYGLFDGTVPVRDNRTGETIYPVDPQVEEQQAKIARVQRLYDRQRGVIAARSAKAAPARRLLDNVDNFLSSGPGALVYAPMDPPSFKGPLAKAIAEWRTKLVDCRSEMHRIASAIYPSGEAIELLKKQVRQMVREPRILHVLNRGDNIGAYFDPAKYISQTNSMPDIKQPDAALFRNVSAVLHQQHESMELGLMAWLLEDLFVQKLSALVMEHADDERALSGPQRDKLMATQRMIEMRVSRELVALIDLAVADGMDEQYDDNLHPMAVLMVERSERPVEVPYEWGAVELRGPRGPSRPVAHPVQRQPTTLADVLLKG